MHVRRVSLERVNALIGKHLASKVGAVGFLPFRYSQATIDITGLFVFGEGESVQVAIHGEDLEGDEEPVVKRVMAICKEQVGRKRVFLDGTPL